MPTIECSFKDIQRLLGKNFKISQLEAWATFAKAEINDKQGDNIKINFEDTNLPYLWSVEGFTRLLKGIVGKQRGLPKLKVNKTNNIIKVDNSISKIRPYIGAFIAKGKKINNDLLEQLIQLQEKISENYGRKREKVSIGIYSSDKVSFPVIYKAVRPKEVAFIPLEGKKEMNLQEILKHHPKGQQYAVTLKGYDKYPILLDKDNNVLSFPPIINSNYSGKVLPGDSNLLVEVTGNDENAVQLSLNVLAYAFQDRGFKIYSIKTKYGRKIISYPKPFNEKIRLSSANVKQLIGLDLSESEIKKLLEKFRYGYGKGVVHIPDYRQDIMHRVDVIEDIAIAYGYDKIPEISLTRYTVGSNLRLNDIVDKARQLNIGLGYQEVMGSVLTNKDLLYHKMNIQDFGTIEIDEYMSENYSVVRTWLLPGLFDILSKNKHQEYPQKIFEQGIIVKKDTKDYERIAAVSCHLKADYTETKQAVDFILGNLGVKYSVEETQHNSFIPGRVARIKVNKKYVGYIGEFHPKVLENFGLELPVVGFEINLSDIFC